MKGRGSSSQLDTQIWLNFQDGVMSQENEHLTCLCLGFLPSHGQIEGEDSFATRDRSSYLRKLFPFKRDSKLAATYIALFLN